MLCFSKKQNQDEFEGYLLDKGYWDQLCEGRNLQLDIEEIKKYYLQFSESGGSDKVMNLVEFKEMIGFIGESFLCERMFKVICPSKDQTFKIKDYIVYQDKVKYGTPKEKNLLQFQMLDFHEKQFVTLKDFDEFWQGSMMMYGEMFNYKVSIDLETKSKIKATFNKLSNGTDRFDFEMFHNAKEANPDLLEDIDNPEQMINNQLDRHPIPYNKFEMYHQQVLNLLSNLQGDTQLNSRLAPCFEEIKRQYAEIAPKEEEKNQKLIGMPLKKQTKSDAGGGAKSVAMGSENFDLALNILVGIRRSLSDLVDSLPSNLTAWQYQKKLTMESEWLSSTKQTKSLFKFTDYAPIVFLSIRHQFQINGEDYIKSVGPEQIMNSLWKHDTEKLQAQCSTGRSGALFYFTSDKKYLLKSISRREFEKLFSILEPYLNHLKQCKESLLIKFVGMYKIEWIEPTNGTFSNTKKNTKYIIVMTNLFREFEVGVRFDLKGSVLDRDRLKEGQTLEGGPDRDVKVSAKDGDFRKHLKSVSLAETMIPNMNLKLVLEKDTQFLMDQRLMDYSLLAGKLTTPIEEIRKAINEDPKLGHGIFIEPNGTTAWQLGIIDPLNEWVFEKKFEYQFKKLKHGGGTPMSCVPPQLYRRRWIEEINKFFVQTSQVIPTKNHMREELRASAEI